MVRGCPYWTMQDFRPFLPVLSYTQEMFDLHSSSDQFVPSPTPLAVCFHFSFFFLTQSSHAFDFSFQTLFLRVTHNAKKRDRETSPASNQTPWPWPCPLFCLTAQSQADTRCFPLSQAEKRGVALDLWLEIRSTALSPSPTDHMMQLLNLTLEFPRTCKDCRIPRSSREHSPEIPVAPEL